MAWLRVCNAKSLKQEVADGTQKCQASEDGKITPGDGKCPHCSSNYAKQNGGHTESEEEEGEHRHMRNHILDRQEGKTPHEHRKSEGKIHEHRSLVPSHHPSLFPGARHCAESDCPSSHVLPQPNCICRHVSSVVIPMRVEQVTDGD